MIITSQNPLRLTWHDISNERLDYSHAVSAVLTLESMPDWNALGLGDRDILMNAPISTAITVFRMWRFGDLRELALAHEMSVPMRATARSLLDRLDEHACSRCCPTVVIVFRKLRRPRSEENVQRALALYEDIPLQGNHGYLKVASEELRRSIIHEWQSAMVSEKFQTKVCGPCGRPTGVADVVSVSPEDFDLQLLQNPALSINVEPTTYAFEAYKKALLHPKGLTNP